MRKWMMAVVVCSLCGGTFLQPGCAKGEEEAGLPQVRTEGMVTMIDLGAKKCIPCKMMAPILEGLKKEYASKASIVFIDVWEAPEQARKYGIRAIPTQIFFDKTGKEVYRHVGFMDKEAIVGQLEKMGVQQPDIRKEKAG